MNMAKKAVAVMCGIMIALMSFTLTDLGNAIGGFPAYEEEKGCLLYTSPSPRDS